MPHALHIGTSGWTYPVWRGVLYPKGLPQRCWLERYAAVFDAVELNASFYRLPSREQFAAWGARTPPGFRFAVKGSGWITHRKRLRDVEGDVASFFEREAGLGAKAEVTLWQLPPHFERDCARLEAFLALLPRGRRHQAIEFRHPSWYAADVYALAAARGVCVVQPDSAARPEMHAPRVRPTADFAYVRFHCGAGREGIYTEAQLRRWARRIARWRRSRDVHAYFNNDWRGFAVRNALRLLELTGARTP